MSIESYVASLPIPGCSPSIGGTFLETIIPGYRTSDVTGRGNLYSTISEQEISTTDGTRYKSKRYNAKDFVVSFYITCDSAENLHNARRKLRAFLNQNRQLSNIIFNDDSAIFYRGIIDGVEDEKLVNSQSVSGRFKIHCPVGDAYSVKEFELTASVVEGKTVFETVYEGTKDAYPVLEATINAETGFIGFLTTDGKIIQIGDPSANAGEATSLVNSVFSDGVPTGWVRNSYTPANDGNVTYTPAGTVKQSGSGITIDSAGTGTNRHGPSLEYDFSDSVEEFEATMSFLLNMNTGEVNNSGGIEFIVIGHDYGSATEKEIARISVYKKDTSSNIGVIKTTTGGTTTITEFKMDNLESNIYTGSTINISKG